MILRFFEKVTDKVFIFLDKVLSKLGLIGDSTLHVMFGNPFRKVRSCENTSPITDSTTSKMPEVASLLDSIEFGTVPSEVKLTTMNHTLDALRYYTTILNPKNDFGTEMVEYKTFNLDRKEDDSSEENNLSHSENPRTLDKSVPEILNLELELSMLYPSATERVFYHVEYDRIFISNTSYDQDGLDFIYLGEV